MKIDLPFVRKLVAAGASGQVVLAYIESQDEKTAKRRKADKERKHADRKRKVADKVRKVAETIAPAEETPRARLFRDGRGVLSTLGVANSRAGALITQWLKLTHDDEQLIMATILKAQQLAVADAAGWILATLRGKTNGQPKRQNLGDIALDLAEEARELEHQAGIGRPPASF